MNAYQLYTTTFGVDPYVQRYATAVASLEEGTVINAQWLRDNNFDPDRIIMDVPEGTNSAALVNELSTSLYTMLTSHPVYPQGDSDVIKNKKKFLNQILNAVIISHTPGKWIKWGETSTRAKTDKHPNIEKAKEKLKEYLDLCNYFFNWEGGEIEETLPEGDNLNELLKLIRWLTHILNPKGFKGREWHGDPSRIEENSMVFKNMLGDINTNLPPYLGTQMLDIGQTLVPVPLISEESSPVGAPVSPFRAPLSPGQTC